MSLSYPHKHLCTCMHVYTNTDEYIHTDMHTHTHTHTHIQKQSHSHRQTHTYICVCVCVCVCVHCHPQTDCFVVSQHFSVAKQIGRFKLGLKPVQHYALSAYVNSGIIRLYLLVFVCLHFALPDTRVFNSFEGLYIYIDLYISSSSCRAACADIPDRLSPFLPIIHRLRQVFRVTS